MMPLTLAVTGFRSYPAPATIDFTGKGLTAVLGDTGAGKSSILEAITYALFGVTTWDARSTSQLIADKCDAMNVDFTFRHDGHRWRVSRTNFRNTTPARHHLTNLDTGEEIDNARAVDARIKSILGMGSETFLRVGLLPQGQFDQLLVASGRERTTRLRELFGADSLTQARETARAQYDRLNGLIGQAELKRATMPDDPAQAAHDAGESAAGFEAWAEQLSGVITAISVLCEQISDCRETMRQVGDAAHRLEGSAGANPVMVLDELRPVADRLAGQQAALAGRISEATTAERDLVERIAARESAGDGVEVLGKAVVLIDGLLARVGDHRIASADAAERDTQLAAENDQIDAATTELDQRSAKTASLTESAEAAESKAAVARARASAARAAVTVAIASASRTVEAVGTWQDAVRREATATQAFKTLGADEGTVTQDIETSEARLATLTQRNQAATLSANLHPGDDCPVCQRELPAAFAPGDTATDTEIHAAQTAQAAAQARWREFRDKLAKAQVTATAAVDTVNQQERTLEQARVATREATEAADRSLMEFATLTDTFDVEAATAALEAAITKVAERVGDPETLIADLVTMITDAERELDDRARSKRREADSHAASVDAETRVLQDRRDALEKARRQAAAESTRLDTAWTRITSDVATLPTSIRTLLPNDLHDLGATEITTAAAAITDRLAQTRVLVDSREKARRLLDTLQADQRELEKSIREQVETPVGELLHQLCTRADTAERISDQHHLGHRPPPRPAVPDIGAVREFAVDLAQVTGLLIQELTVILTGHQHSVDAHTTELRELAGTLNDIDGFDPATDLTEPNAVHPLVAAKATAVRQAEERRTAEVTASAQVKPAADLDFAIAAGKTRAAAVDVLRRELVDAKFLRHLALSNTRSLLGIASDLFGKMTGDRFGFAEDFEIVTRATGVKHPAARLSGGEKFLASLALALALADLHSRSGPRLGSLFLDEGFATLDTDALEAALDVLRTQAGSDRMVIVISHLHAVAEAVDDVLWVQREPTGSTAHWLTAAERDELVNADVAAGLQALT
ncbi:AAA family ATPase [Nocardia sp. NPDC059239]|uniref:AAA family ATPase n=1 Tax=Nocardia sp. NPDC059239 TaxID=3346785 RepID=UPI0036CCFDFB